MPQICINCAPDGRCMKRQALCDYTGAQAAPAEVAEKRIAAIMALVDEFAGARAYATQHPQVSDASRYRDKVRAEVERSLRLVAAAPAAAQPVAQEAVYLVATGETHNGEETYTRHDGAPPPLCDYERLYSTPPPLVGLSDEQIETLFCGPRGQTSVMPEQFDEFSRFSAAIRSGMRALAAANGMTLKEPANG